MAGKPYGGWRAGRLGKFLRIHSPIAHMVDNCWCRGTKYYFGWADISRERNESGE